MNDEQRTEYLEVLEQLADGFKRLYDFCDEHDLSDADDLYFDGTPINQSFDEAWFSMRGWIDRVRGE